MIGNEGLGADDAIEANGVLDEVGVPVEYFLIRLQDLLMSLFFKLQFLLSFRIFLLAASANLVNLSLFPDISLFRLNGGSIISSKSDSDSKLCCCG